MPFTTTMRRAVQWADKIELNGQLARPAFANGAVIHLSRPGAGRAVINPGQRITVADDGSASVTDNLGITHTVRFYKFRAMVSADIPTGGPGQDQDD